MTSTGRHAIYRLYSSAGELLWVGCSQNPYARVYAHGRRAWGSQICLSLTTIEWFDRGSDAAAAELAAIRREQPRHNAAGVSHPYSPPSTDRPKLAAAAHDLAPEPLDLSVPDLSVPDVAKLLKVRPETVRRWLASGAFPGAYRTTDSPKAVWRIPGSAVTARRDRGRPAVLSDGQP
jgi:Helix-turn-helix domain